jgi:hypothetical protein
MFTTRKDDTLCGSGRARRCVMRLAILTLAFASILAFGATFAAAADVAANLSAIPYVTASADANSTVTPVQWYTYRYPRAYQYYSYPYYGYTYPNYGYTYPNYGYAYPSYGYSYTPYYTYRPQYYQYSTPNYGYSYPGSGYYSPNGVYYQAARPYYYRY